MTTKSQRLGLPADADDLRFAPLPRLGDTPAFGYRLLELLELAGFAVAVTAAPFGDGLLVTVSRGDIVIRKQGTSVADVATDLFTEAMAPQPIRGAAA